MKCKLKIRYKAKRAHRRETHLHHFLWEWAFVIFWNADRGNQPIPLSSDHAIIWLGKDPHQDIMGLWGCTILNDINLNRITKYVNVLNDFELQYNSSKKYLDFTAAF